MRLDAGDEKGYSAPGSENGPNVVHRGYAVSERSVRYQPFEAFDGDYAPLLEFAEKHAVLLCPGFAPPAARTPEWVEPPGEQHYWTRRGWRRGDARQGFDVTFRQTIEPRYDGIAASGITVEAYGLPAGVGISITCERQWFDPRYIEMRVSGPESAINETVRGFEARFGPIADRTPEQHELDIELIGIRSALKHQDWRSAIKRAAYVLKFRPDDPEALFALGVGSGATGDVKAALTLLTRAVGLAPNHHDAWYNLGIAYIETGEPVKAVDALERALVLSPGDKDIIKQLDRARKAAKGGVK